MALSKPLAVGAAVLAAAPVVITPLSASAVNSLPSWEQFRSLYDYNTTDPIIDYLYGDASVGVWWKYYYSALMAIVEGVYINSSYEITPSDFSGASGYYLYNGVKRFGSLYASGVNAFSATSGTTGGNLISVFSLQDGDLSVTCYPASGECDFTVEKSVYAGQYLHTAVRRDANTLTDWYTVFYGTGICDTLTYYRTNVYDKWDFYTRFGRTVQEWTTTSAYVSTAFGGRYLLGEAVSFSSLPSSTLYTTITPENALDYVADVLNPYIIEQSPLLEPYLYDPYDGEPIYPTGETVQGMPKEWTVENPALPSYNLDLQLPTANYEDIDVSTPLEQNSSGIRFWWAMLGELFDHFGVKSVAILACALGLFILILTRLGR